MRLPAGALPTLFLLAAAALGGAGDLAAQHVRGRATADPEGRPLPGALVSLLDAGGNTLTAALSEADGSFRLTAPGPGSYTVRGDAVGLGGWSAAVSVGAEGVDVAAPFPPLSLDTGISPIRADDACRAPPAEAGRIRALWAEAEKVFRLVEWARTHGQVQVETETWYKSMEPRRLRVTEEERTPRPGFHVDGRMPSPPAPELAELGFVQGGGPGEALAFHGPDAATLLHPVFLATHCLGFEPAGPEAGWVGLTFVPRGGGEREVEGTLWLDAATGAPRRLEYRYTSLPWPIKTEKVGGGMELAPLENGAWIVGRWWLRMPRVGVREERITQWDPPRRRYTLTGVVEEGGVVTRVRLADGRIESLSPRDP